MPLPGMRMRCIMTTPTTGIGARPGVEGATLDPLDPLDRREPLAVKFDRLLAELEAKDAEIDRFVRAVSHDLKSPLITIKGFLTLLRRDVATGNSELLADDILQIDKAADRLLELLDELFEVHRVGQPDD